MTTARILIVEDDLRLATLTRDFLEHHGLCAGIEADGARAVDRVLDEHPDLVILDRMLPGEDGLSICRRIRPRYAGAILMLSARSEDTEQIDGLENGADDYVCKPVRPSLLLARVRTLLRRPRTTTETADRLEHRGLLLDARQREVQRNGERIDLTGAEFNLLWQLVAHAGQTLSRDDLLLALRGIAWDGMDRSVDVRIAHLRAKLGETPSHPLILTVRGKGYRFVG
ncbi:chemotaxis protein CheY [Pseudomonas sp. 21]|uniref:response regulator n=1 Tax=unclassified Pseudomonas TaxID=196821 RepID=UPI0005EB7582|nr:MULTISPECIES: response regulator [unclassified Pseudomonas]KJK03155.1 chemotaxis protein CheY [Pseudomonas sp. 21]MBV7584658.1 winged helix-turn-helix domain-containing protein [Pseudomonas sp. PDM33]